MGAQRVAPDQPCLLQGGGGKGHLVILRGEPYLSRTDNSWQVEI